MVSPPQPPPSAGLATAPNPSVGSISTGQPSAVTTKKPSGWAKKLLSKLDGLADGASTESQQTVASWIAFNRKRKTDFADAFSRATTAASSPSVSSSRCLLLLKVAHRVIVSNAPDPSSEAENADVTAASLTALELWEKSSELRVALGETALEPLLATVALRYGVAGEVEKQVIEQVDDMINEWKYPPDALGGPTIWEGIKRGWKQELQRASAPKDTDQQHQKRTAGDDGAAAAPKPVADAPAAAAPAEPSPPAPVEPSVPSPPAPAEPPVTSSKSGETETANGGPSENSREEGKAVSASVTQSATKSASTSASAPVSTPATPLSSTKVKTEERGGDETETDEDSAIADEGKESMEIEKEETAPSVNTKVKGEGSENAKRDEGDEIDFEKEGVKQGKVEPNEFLDACKVIASIQITRDLGSDTAMGISSALASFPQEVEDACKKIQKSKAEGSAAASSADDDDRVDPAKLSALPDDILDLDLEEARQSLASYGETIRKQRAARLRCVELLLRSRCDFGSGNAAAAFLAMTTALEKLKDRKEQLSDAMALEGLDVEEDPEDEKREAEMDGRLEELHWYTPEGGPGGDDAGGTEEEGPAAKKAKVVA